MVSVDCCVFWVCLCIVGGCVLAVGNGAAAVLAIVAVVPAVTGALAVAVDVDVHRRCGYYRSLMVGHSCCLLWLLSSLLLPDVDAIC